MGGPGRTARAPVAVPTPPGEGVPPYPSNARTALRPRPFGRAEGREQGSSALEQPVEGVGR